MLHTEVEVTMPVQVKQVNALKRTEIVAGQAVQYRYQLWAALTSGGQPYYWISVYRSTGAAGQEELAISPLLGREPAMAWQLLQRLAEGLVSPIHLVDIVRDWLVSGEASNVGPLPASPLEAEVGR